MNDDVKKMFEEHIKDDLRQFKALHDKFDTFPKIIEQAVKTTVNGKIDDMRGELDKHIVRVEPVIAAYEQSQATKKSLNTGAGVVIKISQVIIALGVIGGLIFWVIKANL